MFCWSGGLRPECASIFLEDDGHKVDVGDSTPVFRDGSRESIRLGRPVFRSSRWARALVSKLGELGGEGDISLVPQIHIR